MDHKKILGWTGNHFIDNKHLKEALKSVIDLCNISTMGSSNAEELKDALSEYYSLPPEWFAIGVGSTHIIESLVNFFSDHKILNVTPDFGICELVAQKLSCEYKSIKVRYPEEFIPALQSKLTSKKTALFLSSPRNPYGYSFSKEQIIQASQIINGVVIVDEAYVEFSEAGNNSLIKELESHQNIILIRTFSKAWGLASLRVGYSIWHRSQLLVDKKHLLPWCVGELDHKTAIFLLKNPEKIHQSINETINAKNYLYAKLSSLPKLKVWPSDANYLCIEFEEIDLIQIDLLQKGIKIMNTSTMRTWSMDYPSACRIAACDLSIAEQVIETFKEFTSSSPKIA